MHIENNLLPICDISKILPITHIYNICNRLIYSNTSLPYLHSSHLIEYKKFQLIKQIKDHSTKMCLQSTCCCL